MSLFFKSEEQLINFFVTIFVFTVIYSNEKQVREEVKKDVEFSTSEK